MVTYVWDIECNGFTRDATQLWMSVLLNVDTKEVLVFTDHDPKYPNVSESYKLMDTADKLIGHNILRYDAPVFERLTGHKLNRHKLVDTIIYSRLNEFKRVRTNYKHSLKALAKQAGNQLKKDYEGGFDAYSQEMVDYCIDDVKANLSVYKLLMKETNTIKSTMPNYDEAVTLEHQMAYWSSQQVKHGWKLDTDLLHKTLTAIKEEIHEIEKTVEPTLGTMQIFIDKEPKTPKYKKNGEYTVVSARILSEYLNKYVDPCDALAENPPIKPKTQFQRTQIIEARLGNQDHLKEFLYTKGWEPDEWNWKKEGKEFIKKSPKLTTTSLKKLGKLGENIDRFFTLRARQSILTGWLEHIHDGRLYGDVMDIGAATGRQSHKIIANIPSPKAAYGSEIRSMFIAPEGKTIISADGASYQARVAVHFAKDEEFSNEILAGDIHQKNADTWEVSRNAAKPGMFAIFFGSGGAKLARILGVDEKDGTKKLKAFWARWPALAELSESVKSVALQRKWLKGIDGRRIYTEEPYKAFNYLIQGTEAILMKRTVVRINEAFEREGIDAKQLLFYHDECSWEIWPKDAERCTEIIKHWFHEAPKELGVTIMEAGDCKVGSNYLQVH